MSVCLQCYRYARRYICLYVYLSVCLLLCLSSRRSCRYEDSSFDAVVDKGTLDALMSEDTLDVRESGQAMLREVARVLKPGGRYQECWMFTCCWLNG